MNTNPLLNLGDKPDFAALRAEHVTPALDVLLAQAHAALQHAVGAGVATTYDALSLALDVPVERLRRAWGSVGHLHAVCDTPALRAAYSDNLERVTDFYTRLGADAALYAKYKAVHADPSCAQLGADKRKALKDALRDFVLGGAELAGAARERFAQIQARSAALSQQFGEHVLDATDDFALYVDEGELDGAPQDVVATARAAAAAEGRGDFKLSLQDPCLRPLLAFAHSRQLRERLYTAHAQRASELGPPQWDNSALMQELLALRQEEAQLLGHDTYAQLSLVPKMAHTPEQVLSFVHDLAQRARPFAERELAELRAFAASELGLSDLQAWDRAYASEQMRQRRHHFSSDEVKRYFTAPRVLQGLFALIERLFDVHIAPDSAPVWHPCVQYCRVERAGVPMGGFYLDLYAREGKQSGAWMDEAQQRWRRPDSGRLQLPVAHLVCNFAAPVGTQPALLSHDDVITLFHEFGHGLHHLLTQVDDAAVAGISGVEWDAVEVPSQFMENFCWEWDVLQGMSAHVDSGEPLPRALFERMLAARQLHKGLALMRNCEYAMFDMRLHTQAYTQAQAPQQVAALADEVAKELSLLPPPPFLRYPHSFTHIFDGGYAAGFYGYAWAEVMSADAYEAFEESGIFDASTGRRFRQAILESGGSRPALESFKAFRGREPRLDALLRHQGLA
jgi:oligopeptidase A